jgi:hypothetical protein
MTMGGLSNSAVAFKGLLAKVLARLGIEFYDGTKMLTGTTDPTGTAVDAPDGSIYINTSLKQVYIKQDAGSTKNWIAIDISKYLSGVQQTGVLDASAQTFTASGKTISVGGTRSYVVAGIKFEKTNTETLDADGTGGSATAGMRYYYYDSAQVLKQSESFLDFTTQAIAYIGFGYFDGTNLTRLALEPHKYNRDVFWHYVQHLTMGMVYSSGLDVTYTATSGGGGGPAIAAATDAAATMYLNGGLFFDEDVPISITHTATPGTLPYGQNLGTAQSLAAGFGPSFVSWNGATSKFVRTAPMSDKTIFPYTGANGLPQWNNQATGALTALTDQQFGVYWIIVTNNVNNGIAGQTSETIFVRPHNAAFATLAAAQGAAVTDLVWTGFPVAEFKVCYRVIFEARNAYVNSTHRCTVREVIDYRKSNLSNAAISSGTVSAASVSVSTAGFTGALQGLTTGSVPVTNNNQQLVNSRVDLFGFIGSWSATDAALGYNIGNTVKYLGRVWRCTTANADVVFDQTKWEALAIGFAADVTAQELYSGNDGDLVFNVNNQTIYMYFAAGGSYTRDGTTVLDTADGGLTRWLALSGAYRYGSTIMEGDLIPNQTAFSLLGSFSSAWNAVFALNLDTQSTTNTTLGIGTSFATVVNIGRSGAAINLYGSTTYIESTNTQLVDKLITLNKGGAAASGSGVGIEVEENNVITRYIKTHGTAATLEWIANSATGVILTNGGNTIGGTLTIGAKDAQIVNIVTGTSVIGVSISTAGVCTFPVSATIGSTAASNHPLGVIAATNKSASMSFTQNSTVKAYIGVTGSGGDSFLAAATSGDLVIRSEANNIFFAGGSTSYGYCIAGEWTFGLAAGSGTSNLTHTIQADGSCSLNLTGSSNTGRNAVASFKCGGTTGGGTPVQYEGTVGLIGPASTYGAYGQGKTVLNNSVTGVALDAYGASGTITFYTGGIGNLVGIISSTGACTWGPSTPSDGLGHLFNGSTLSLLDLDGTMTVLTSESSKTYIDSRGVNTSTNGSFAFRTMRSNATNTINGLEITPTGIIMAGYSGGTQISGTVTNPTYCSMYGGKDAGITLAADAVWEMQNYGTNKGCLVLIYESENGHHAIVSVGYAGSSIIHSTGSFNATKDNAGTLNVYHDISSGTQVRVQNKFAGNKTIYITIIGTRLG